MSSSLGMFFFWVDDVSVAFTGRLTSLPFLKIIALAFSLGFTTV
jgi:hypothetical protein